MLRALLGFVALVVLIVPGVADAHGGAEVIVRADVRVNGPIAIEGTGFEADTPVALALEGAGQPLPLGTTVAGTDGAFNITLHVPADVKPGLYRVTAQGGDDSVSADITVLEPAAPAEANAQTPVTASPVNDRPRAESVGIGVLATVFGLAGLASLTLSRTHPGRSI